jgi:transcriptional regulator with XRE-family HTH domain
MKNNPYAAFGQVVAEGRKKAGLLQQSDLALTIGTSQQTVSRWEAGTARPRKSQLGKLAEVLQIDEPSLRQAAGYEAPGEMLPTSVAVSFDEPFPVDALSPESFERCVEDIVRGVHADAREIRRIGKSGHTQAGIDILAVLHDGTRHTFQCKRATRFGPADVKAAVVHQSEKADYKHLVLSRVASPQTAETVRAHPGWVLWDKEDLSRLIRTKLSPEARLTLVDKYFQGQRFALLGKAAAGPWQTPAEFFAPFESAQATFSHSWSLVGRDREVADILAAIDRDARVTLLIAMGGLGKSRVIKQVSEEIAKRMPDTRVLFLSPSEQATAQSLDELGNHPKILVVDDAHDRADLSALFAYAANPAHSAQVLLALRPYAEARLRGQAATFALAGTIEKVELCPLTLAQTTELAAQVLAEFKIPRRFAEHIAQATRDCPLITVIAARIAAQDEIPLALAQDTAAFRDTILGKFAAILTGNLAAPSEQKPITEILKVIALVQPFAVDDVAFRALAMAATGLSEDIVASTLRTLVNGGVVYRRGSQYRLMPDLLGDYIIERTCIDTGDRLTSFADRVFELAPDPLLGHVLVNLGRLDWRRNFGDQSRSHLLDHLWRALKVGDSYHMPALEAASAAAVYQPRQAIDFVTAQLRAGSKRDEFAEILKNAAYNLDHVTEVCALLWEMGRRDDREQSRLPRHAMRVLTDLCTVEPEKPLKFNERVVEFGLDLTADRHQFDFLYSPFDFLKGILSGEGHTTTGNRRTITLAPYFVNYDVVAPLRGKVVAAALKLVQSPSVKVAVRAVRFLESALRYPMSIMGARVPDELYALYGKEFEATLVAVDKIVRTGTLDPVVVIAIAHAISWHVNFANKGTHKVAKKITARYPTSLEFRVLSALADGFGRIFLRFDPNTWQMRLNKWIADIVADLARDYPDAGPLRQLLESSLLRIREAELAKDNSSHTLIFELLRTRADLAVDVVESALQYPEGPLASHQGNALFFVLEHGANLGRYWARRFLDSGHPTLQIAVAQAYRSPTIVEGALVADDADILKRVLGSPNPVVVQNALHALGSLSRLAPRLALDFLRHINLASNPRLADDLFLFFHVNRTEAFDAVDEDDVRFILSQLKPLSELNGYWIETTLAELSVRFPVLTSEFFLDRVALATADDESFSRYRVINYGPWVQVPLRFKETPHYRDVLERVWAWMAEHDSGDWRFEHHAGNIFEGMFLPVDDQVIAFLSTKIAAASRYDLRWIATILSHAEPDFVFTRQVFVERFLEACDREGPPARRKGIDSLFRASISGVRSGRPGEPFPRDLDLLTRVEPILPRLSRLSGAYELYDLIRRNAERDIAMQRQEAEFFDDE